MGYSIRLHDNRFTIQADKTAAALAALKGESDHNSFQWTDDLTIQETDTLSDALEECGWPLTLDADGNVVDIHFCNDKAGEEARIFTTLAPFVDSGCYIEIRGEDGDRWRYVFDGHSMKTVRPTVVWPA